MCNSRYSADAAPNYRVLLCLAVAVTDTFIYEKYCHPLLARNIVKFKKYK